MIWLEVANMRRTTAKGISQTREIVRDGQDEVAADFIRVELELADTFCQLALETHSPERARQRRLNARRALDSALHALAKVKMKEKEFEETVSRMEEVKALVESLEAGGSSPPNC